jgi:hypothetical protein
MSPPPGTLSDILAEEKSRLLRDGPSGYHLSTQMPSIDDLKLLHDRLVHMAREGDGGIHGAFQRAKTKELSTTQRPRTANIGIHSAEEGSLLQHAVSHRPSLLQQHGTAVRVSAEAADTRKQHATRKAPVQSAPMRPAGSRASDSDGKWGIAARDSAGAASSSSMRSIGGVAYSTSDVRATPSGYRRALKLCHERGGRLSAASIPSQISTQAALDTLQTLAQVRVPEFSMLLPDQYHAACQVLRHNRLMGADTAARETEEYGATSPRMAAACGLRRSCSEAALPSDNGPWPGGGQLPRAGHQPRPQWSRMSHSGAAVPPPHCASVEETEPSQASASYMGRAASTSPDRTANASRHTQGRDSHGSGASVGRGSPTRAAVTKGAGPAGSLRGRPGTEGVPGTCEAAPESSLLPPGRREPSAPLRSGGVLPAGVLQRRREAAIPPTRLGTPPRAANPPFEMDLAEMPMGEDLAPPSQLGHGRTVSAQQTSTAGPRGTGGGNLRQVPFALRRQGHSGGALPVSMHTGAAALFPPGGGLAARACSQPACAAVPEPDGREAAQCCCFATTIPGSIVLQPPPSSEDTSQGDRLSVHPASALPPSAAPTAAAAAAPVRFASPPQSRPPTRSLEFEAPPSRPMSRQAPSRPLSRQSPSRPVSRSKASLVRAASPPSGEHPGGLGARVALGPHGLAAGGGDGRESPSRQLLGGATAPSIPSRPGTAPLLIMTAGGAQPPTKAHTEAAARHRLRSAPWRGDK